MLGHDDAATATALKAIQDVESEEKEAARLREAKIAQKASFNQEYDMGESFCAPGVLWSYLWLCVGNVSAASVPAMSNFRSPRTCCWPSTALAELELLGDAPPGRWQLM